MVSQEIQNSLLAVSNRLLLANNELNRPNNDIVTLSVCEIAYNCMLDMISLYLTNCNVQLNNDMSLEELFSLCKETSTAFTKIDITAIECKDMKQHSCNRKYCLCVENIESCIKCANHFKEVIWSELAL